MKYLSLMIATLGLAACSGGGDSPSKGMSNSTTPEGTYFRYTNVLGGTYYYELQFTSGNKFQYILAYAPIDQTKVDFRKETGTYVIEGNKLTVNYEYSTCNGLGTSEYNFSGNTADTMNWSFVGAAQTYLFKSTKKYSLTGFDIKNVSMITEDKSCTFFAKIPAPDFNMIAKASKPSSLRIPASVQKRK